MAKGPPLTKRRKAWADKRGGGVFYGKPLTHPVTTEVRYRATLDRAIAQMAAVTERELMALWGSQAERSVITSGMDASLASQSRILMNAMARRFQVFFDRLAPIASEAMVKGVDQHSKASLHASLKDLSGGLSLKTSVITGRVREVTKAAVAENTALIKSIPREYIARVRGAVMRGIQSGNGAQTIYEALVKTRQITDNRAKLIARDQTSKATTALNSARLDNLGVRQFEWLHSAGGEVPRPLHLNVLNGNIYSLDNPPVIDDKTGERGLPGQLINCRCRMIPVVTFGTVEE